MDDSLKRNLIAELELEKLPAEKQEEVLLQAGNVIMQSILNRAVPLLTDKEQVEFGEILEKEQGGEAGMLVFNFLKSKVPNIDTLIKEEIAEFKRETNSVMSKIG